MVAVASSASYRCLKNAVNAPGWRLCFQSVGGEVGEWVINRHTLNTTQTGNQHKQAINTNTNRHNTTQQKHNTNTNTNTQTQAQHNTNTQHNTLEQQSAGQLLPTWRSWFVLLLKMESQQNANKPFHANETNNRNSSHKAAAEAKAHHRVNGARRKCIERGTRAAGRTEGGKNEFQPLF